MSLERIDPFEREDRFCVDHMLRYAWAAPAVAGKRVVDAACGSGFGTALLAHANAAEVVGVDLSEGCVRHCSEVWKLTNARFVEGNVEDLGCSGVGPFDVAVTFETLEHVERPERALDALRSVLSEGGVVIGSVPGETDALEANEFHLHAFDRAKLLELLRPRFRNVKIFAQSFRVASVVEGGSGAAGSPLRWSTPRCLDIDFGGSETMADTYLFLASDGELPELPVETTASSRRAWMDYHGGARTAYREVERLHIEIKRLHGRFRMLFGEHGDLLRRFTNVLAWGKFHFEQLHGRTPEVDYLAKIEAAKSHREDQLRKTVEELQSELASVRGERDQMKIRLEEVETLVRSGAAQRRETFEGVAGPDAPGAR